MDIFKRNKQVAESVINWLVHQDCIVLRLSNDDKQLISGDIDVFVSYNKFQTFRDSLYISLSSDHVICQSKPTLSGYYIYIVGKEWSGFCKLDIHFREIYKNIPLLLESELADNTYIDDLGLERPSLKNQNWIQYCFYFLNNHIDDVKFLEAENYLRTEHPEKLVPDGIRFEHFSAKKFYFPHRLRREFLFIKLLLSSAMSPMIVIQLQFEYFKYMAKKVFNSRQEIKFNGALTEKTVLMIELYFRGQPISFDNLKGKEIPVIKAIGSNDIKGHDLDLECRALLRSFFKAL
jgi:hypothetical protein